MRGNTIDWAAIHHRLAVAAAAVAGGLEPDPEETCRILAARAKAAARPAVKEEATARLEVLTFTLAGESYGVETRHVREVCQLKDLTSIPCTPPFVAGVLNLRGRIVAIIDLRQFFELPAKGLTDLNRVIVLEGAGHELGLLADAIGSVRAVVVPELQAALPTLTGIRERFLLGITGQLLAVLDGARLLGDAGLEVNDHATR